jgi:hypothetical protein
MSIGLTIKNKADIKIPVPMRNFGAPKTAILRTGANRKQYTLLLQMQHVLSSTVDGRSQVVVTADVCFIQLGKTAGAADSR